MTESAAVTSATGKINWLLSACGVAIIGQGMALSAAPLLAADLSRNPIAVSGVAAASYAAVLLLGLPAGALVDRWRLRRVMVLTDLVRFVLLGVFAGLLAAGFVSMWMLIVLVFLVGIGNSFFDPAAQAAIPGLVGKERTTLARANGKLWALDTFGRGLAGPPLGAAAFAIAVALPFGLQSVAFLMSAALLTRIGEPRAPRAPTRLTLRTDIREGVVFLARQAKLRALTLGTATYNFAYNIAAAPFILFAQDRLGLGSVGYGILVSLSAVGGIVGGWVGARLTERLSAFHVSAGALALQGAGWALIATSSHVIVVGLGMLLLGVASTTVSVVVGSARQMLTPEEMLGRVVAGARVLGVGSAAVGALLGGVIAQSTSNIGAPLLVAIAISVLAVVPFVLPRRRS